MKPLSNIQMWVFYVYPIDSFNYRKVKVLTWWNSITWKFIVSCGICWLHKRDTTSRSNSNTDKSMWRGKLIFTSIAECNFIAAVVSLCFCCLRFYLSMHYACKTENSICLAIRIRGILMYWNINWILYRRMKKNSNSYNFRISSDCY